MSKIENIISIEKADPSVKNDAILYKGEVFTFFDSGLTRHVYVNDSKTKVIKVLIEKHSIDYNQVEVDVYNRASDETKKQLAETSFDGYVIEQEYCNPIKMDERKMTIPQIMFASSCRNEVGWTADGRLVCFDLDEYKRY